MRKILTLLIASLSLFAFSAIAGEHDHGNEHSCPAAGKTVVEKVDIEMTGEVLCMHCDLHEADSCHKVFVASDEQETRYEICPEGAVDITSTHGPVIVVGKQLKTDDGTLIVRVESTKDVAQPSDS